MLKNKTIICTGGCGIGTGSCVDREGAKPHAKLGSMAMADVGKFGCRHRKRLRAESAKKAPRRQTRSAKKQIKKEKKGGGLRGKIRLDSDEDEYDDDEYTGSDEDDDSGDDE